MAGFGKNEHKQGASNNGGGVVAAGGAGSGRAPEGARALTDGVVSRAECSDPIDFTFLFLASLEDAQDSTPRESPRGNLHYDVDLGKYRTTAIKLANNILIDTSGFDTFLDSIIIDAYNNLQSIDLSFNELTKIDESLTKYPNIRSLYLHGNSIERFNEVHKLKTMSNLKRLTLHGNPIDHMPQYRAAVISLLPSLNSFDFSGVTKNDRFVSKNINIKKIRKA